MNPYLFKGLDVLPKRGTFYIYIYHHHHHVVPQTRISLTLSRHFTLSFIASGRSSGLHPVSSRSCCMWVRAGRPAFARPYEGVHRNKSLMSSSLLLQQCPACLVRLTLIVFVMGGRWSYSWCFGGVPPGLVQYCSLPFSSFFSSLLVSVHVAHPYSNIETNAAWKKPRFILLVWSDFHMTDSLSIAVQVNMYIYKHTHTQTRTHTHTHTHTHIYIYIYIYIYIEECIFRQQVIIQASFVKDDGTLSLLFLILFFKTTRFFSSIWILM